MLTSDVDISQTAQAAELFLSDGIIVTGAATGSAVNATDLKGKLLNAHVSSVFHFIYTLLSIQRRLQPNYCTLNVFS